LASFPASHAARLLYCVSDECWGMKAWIASFPGSHAPEHERWSSAGGRAWYFFLTWEAVKVEGGKKNLIVCGRTRDSEQEKERR